MSELIWHQTRSSELAQALGAGDLLEARRLLRHHAVDPQALKQAQLLDDPAAHLLLREQGVSTLLPGSQLEPWLEHMARLQRADALETKLPPKPSQVFVSRRPRF